MSRSGSSRSARSTRTASRPSSRQLHVAPSRQVGREIGRPPRQQGRQAAAARTPDADILSQAAGVGAPIRFDQAVSEDDDAALSTRRRARKPVSMKRAQVWTLEVENEFRAQEAGYRNLEEYIETHGEPPLWENGMIAKLKAKGSGFFTYWRKHRECEDKWVPRVKVFEYAKPASAAAATRAGGDETADAEEGKASSL